MRRVELLIAQSRRATESENFSEDTGIPDAEFLQYLNDAQDRVYGKILSVFPSCYMDEKIVSVVYNQEAYDLPEDAFLGSRTETIEYSSTGQEADYRLLRKVRIRERYNGNAGTPDEYVRRGKQILLQPKPADSSATLRINYYKKLPTLDKRRAQVLDVTLVDDEITVLHLDPTLLTQDDIDDIQLYSYITIVDKDGVIQMKNIPVSSVDGTTGLVTLDGAFHFEEGETIAVGNWVCVGQYSTTHSQLDDSCERYLIAHTDWKILFRDSSTDQIEENKELTQMITDIMEAYTEADEDVDGITVLDEDYMSSEGW